MLSWTAKCKAVCSSSQAQTSGYGLPCHHYQSWCSIDDTPGREIEDLRFWSYYNKNIEKEGRGKEGL